MLVSRCQGRGVCNGRDGASGPCAEFKYCPVMREKTAMAVTVPVNQAAIASAEIAGCGSFASSAHPALLRSKWLSMFAQAIVTQQGRSRRGLYKQRKQNHAKGNGLNGPPVVK